jgi:hypothetical protein
MFIYRFDHLSSSTKADTSKLINSANVDETLINTTANKKTDKKDEISSASLLSSRLDSPCSLPIQFYSSSFELSDLPLDYQQDQQQDQLDAFFLSRKNSIKLKRSLLNKHRPLSYVEMSSSNTAASNSQKTSLAPETTTLLNGLAKDLNECKNNSKLPIRPAQMHPHHHNHHSNFNQHTNLLQVNNHRHHHHANTSPHLSILDIKHFSSNLSMSGNMDADNDHLSSLLSSSSSSCSSNSNENNHLVTTDDVILISREEVISKYCFTSIRVKD